MHWPPSLPQPWARPLAAASALAEWHRGARRSQAESSPVGSVAPLARLAGASLLVPGRTAPHRRSPLARAAAGGSRRSRRRASALRRAERGAGDPQLSCQLRARRCCERSVREPGPRRPGRGRELRPRSADRGPRRRLPQRRRPLSPGLSSTARPELTVRASASVCVSAVSVLWCQSAAV